jgi:hypothetical protein
MVRLDVDKTDCSSITVDSGKNKACVVYAYGPDGKVIYEETMFFPIPDKWRDWYEDKLAEGLKEAIAVVRGKKQSAGMIDGGRAYNESLWESLFGK